MATTPFNPLAYGAKPVATTTAGFDPVVHGAVPVATAPTVASAPKKTVLEKAGSVLNALFPSKAIGDVIGTDIARAVAPKDQKKYINYSSTPLQRAGDIAQNALYFLPVSRVAGAAEKVVAKVAPRLAPAAAKAITGAGTGYAFDVANSASQGREDVFKPGAGTALGVAAPVAGGAGKLVAKAGQDAAPRIINSLIKPLSKDFAYGKNPGKAVAELGITANSREELTQKISEAKAAIGVGLHKEAAKVPDTVRIDFSHATEPFDEAIKKAVANNDQALLTRLTNARAAITQIFSSNDGKIEPVGTRLLGKLTYAEGVAIKQRIGELTKWTGQATEDKTVNGALTRAYGTVKQGLDTAAEAADPLTAARLRKFNQTYADLLSAESSAKRQEALHARQNMVNLPGKIGLGMSLVAAPFTGGLSTVLAGIASVGLDKALSSPAFKTRLAAALAQSTPEEMRLLEEKSPGIISKLRNAVGPITSPGDAILDRGQAENRSSMAQTMRLNEQMAMSPSTIQTNSGTDGAIRGPMTAASSIPNASRYSIPPSIPQPEIPATRSPQPRGFVTPKVASALAAGTGAAALASKALQGASAGVAEAANGPVPPENMDPSYVYPDQAPAEQAPAAPVRPSNASAEIIPPSAHLAPVIQDASKKTGVPANVLSAILLMESSMANDDTNQNPKIGRYAWLAGLTNTAKKDLKRAGIDANYNTRDGALKAAGDFWNLLQERYPDASPADLYFKHYYAGPEDTADRRALFEQALASY